MEEYLENKKAGDLTPVGELIACSTLFEEEPECTTADNNDQADYI